MKYEKISIWNLKLSIKNFIPTTEESIPINTMKWCRSCNHFPSFMSEPILSTRSKTCMHLKKFKFLSSHPSPETNFRHAQGRQRTTELTGSISFFRSTIITVYEVVHKKTVKKIEKRNKWISEVTKEIYQYFQEKTKNTRHKKIANKLALHC